MANKGWGYLFPPSGPNEVGGNCTTGQFPGGETPSLFELGGHLPEIP